MKQIVFVIALGVGGLFGQASFGQASKDQCTSAENAVTEWGNTHQTINLIKKPIKTAKGKVRDLEDNGVNILVEVLELDPGDPKATRFQSHKLARKRLAACVTGPSGKFEFDLPDGYYELLFTKKDLEPASVLAVINKKKGDGKELTIRLWTGF